MAHFSTLRVNYYNSYRDMFSITWRTAMPAGPNPGKFTLLGHWEPCSSANGAPAKSAGPEFSLNRRSPGFYHLVLPPCPFTLADANEHRVVLSLSRVIFFRT